MSYYYIAYGGLTEDGQNPETIFIRITEDEDVRITEDGETRITE